MVNGSSPKAVLSVRIRPPLPNRKERNIFTFLDQLTSDKEVFFCGSVKRILSFHDLPCFPPLLLLIDSARNDNLTDTGLFSYTTESKSLVKIVRFASLPISSSKYWALAVCVSSMISIASSCLFSLVTSAIDSSSLRSASCFCNMAFLAW